MSKASTYTEFMRGTSRCVKVGEKKYVLRTEKWESEGEGIINFSMRPDDVFVMTLPRSGTTMTLEIIWLLQNNLDYESAKKFHLEERVPELEVSLYPFRWQEPKVVMRNEKDPKVFELAAFDNSEPSYKVFGKISSPRIFKTHLPLSLYKNFPDSGAKIIYIARDPKDRLVSLWRFVNGGESPYWRCNFRELWKCVKSNEIAFGPVWEHLREAWTLRNQSNILFLFYEDIRTDFHATLKKIAQFLGKTYTDEEIAGLAQHMDIDNFRQNPMVNSLNGFSLPEFIGQGKIGRSKDVIPDDIDREIDEWIEENLKELDITFPSLQNKSILNKH